jgi:hypothetical protein
MSISPISSNSLLNSADLSSQISGANQSTTSTNAVSSPPTVAASNTSARLAKDISSLRWDMTSGNTPAARTDAGRVEADLLAEEASVPSINPLGSPLDISVDSISDSVSGGSVQGAPNPVTYQPTNGSTKGDHLNTSA